MNIKLSGLTLGFVVAFSGAVRATPIEYIFTGTGTGTLGTTSFTDASFTVSLVGDTSTVTQTDSNPPDTNNIFQNSAVVVGGLSGSSKHCC